MSSKGGFMRKFRLLFACMIIISMLSACTGSEKADDMKSYMKSIYGENEVIGEDWDKSLGVTCANGTFVGVKENDVISYKGIPYAQAPTGDLRWKDPVPVKDSDQIYEAYYYGKSPIQSEWPSEVGSYYECGEDCLNLNVWVNMANTGDRKPVMVFIHGGSYGWGATSDPMYDGYNLVSKHDDIILVTVEYRVGMMGFIDFSQVEGGEDFASSGNLGLLDQVCALQWIRKNIASFGGDPDNVTVFGESAGGGSVSLLPIMDQAKGLFRRVIAESGSVALTFSREECLMQTQLLLETSGCSNMEELMALDQDALMAISDEISDCNNFPERDGVILPEDLYGEYASGKASDIDMMIGTNADECRYWINEMGYYTDLISGKTIYSIGLPVMFDNNLLQMTEEDQDIARNFVKDLKGKKIWNITEFYNEMLFRLPAVRQADLQADNGGNTYVYYWTYPSAYKDIGACHAVELAYVFGNLEDTAYTGDNIDPALSETVQNMWVNYARCGDPGTEDTPWPEYTTDTRTAMVFDSGNVHTENDIKKDQREKLSPLLKYMLNGCYSQMSYNVPAVYKLIAMAAGALAVLIGIVIILIRRIRKKHRH